MGKGPDDERDWRDNETANDPVGSFLHARLSRILQHSIEKTQVTMALVKQEIQEKSLPVCEVVFCDWWKTGWHFLMGKLPTFLKFLGHFFLADTIHGR